MNGLPAADKGAARARAGVTWVWFVLALVAINFGFDWWRRLDFEAQKRRIETTLSGLRDQILTELVGARALSASLEDRFGEVERLFSGIGETIASIKAVAAGPGTARDEGLGPDPPAAGGPETAAEAPGPRRLLEVPIEEMEAGLEGVASDPYLASRYGDLVDMRTWDPAKIIEDLEGEFGVRLGDEQRELVKVEIEYFRQLGHVAYSRFQAEKLGRLAERIMTRDYDLPDEHGVFADLNLPQGEVFASATLGYRRFAWERSKEPEMYRWNCLFKYVPLAMLERLRAIFKKGRS
ncbi:MAG: hypothetical protein HY721_13285 [Planctomycetes bacterium]|nr:hypothetical protein [Planctomycetota bacterium]